MTVAKSRATMAFLASVVALWVYSSAGALDARASSSPEAQAPEQEESMQIQYLEIVTPDVDATCSTLESIHGVSFGEPEPAFGNARTAVLHGGGRIGVRAPMREDEDPVVRHYLLVRDIEAAVEAAEAAGGDFAMYPTEIPGHGRFAIYFQGGIQYGLWEL